MMKELLEKNPEGSDEKLRALLEDQHLLLSDIKNGEQPSFSHILMLTLTLQVSMFPAL
jgi:hypothetical protein